MKPTSSFVLVAFLTFSTLQAADGLNPSNPERNIQPGVPQGKITSGVFAESRVFPGTRRDYKVYVPAQYSPDTPVSLMVFQDGAGYAKLDGAYRVPVVLDNLIHQKVLPVTIDQRLGKKRILRITHPVRQLNSWITVGWDIVRSGPEPGWF